MALRLFAKQLISAFAILLVAACVTGPGGQTAFSWEPETQAELDLRLKAEALQSTVGEGGTAGFALGVLLGGVTGGMQGAFIGGRLGRFVGSASGAYVRGLQEDYATREAQLDRLAQDLALNNGDLESAIATMRVVLAEQQAALAAARASGDQVALGRARDKAAGTVATMNLTVEAATNRQAVLGEARSLVVASESQPGVAPVNKEYEDLAKRIATMRSIATTLVSEI